MIHTLLLVLQTPCLSTKGAVLSFTHACYDLVAILLLPFVDRSSVHGLLYLID